MGPFEQPVTKTVTPKKFDVGSLMNFGTMAAGIAQSAMAKKPELVKPVPLKSFIRPARGNEAGLQRNLNAIEGEGAKAMRDVTSTAGSSVSANMAGRLGILDKLIKAKGDAVGANANLIREDQNRVDQQVNNEAAMNNQLENQFNLQNNDREYREWMMKKAGGLNMIQGALNYGTEKRADRENKGVLENQANQGIDLKGQSAVDAARLEYIRAGKEFTPEIEEGIRASYGKYKTSNYKKGGSVDPGPKKQAKQLTTQKYENAIKWTRDQFAKGQIPAEESYVLGHFKRNPNIMEVTSATTIDDSGYKWPGMIVGDSDLSGPKSLGLDPTGDVALYDQTGQLPATEKPIFKKNKGGKMKYKRC